jgi:Cu+-exporting ATPase
VEGRSAVDEFIFTGESTPLMKAVGDRVSGAAVNQSGAFVMRADRVGRDPTLAQIVQMAAEAQRGRAPIQRLADQVLGWFVPLFVAATIAALIAWASFGLEPRLTYGLVAAVSALRQESWSRTRRRFALLEKVGTLVVDKTGALTETSPRSWR